MVLHPGLFSITMVCYLANTLLHYPGRGQEVKAHMSGQNADAQARGWGPLMPVEWNEDQPIYRQLMEQFIGFILEGTFREGEAMPSVRRVATAYEVNPLTAARVYQELFSEHLLEKRRGIGMFLKTGVRDALLKAERKKFLQEEWPAVLQRMDKLGLDPKELL